jgi:molybdopterin molybdotransferase
MANKTIAIGYPEAIKTVLSIISPMASQNVPIGECTDRVVAEVLYAIVDSPSVHASQKDGYAVRSKALQNASPQTPVRLKVVDTAAAGLPSGKGVSDGVAIRILTGARIPEGADAVVAEEYAHPDKDDILVTNTAEPGRNIIPQGADVTLGERLCRLGERLTPGLLGILAAAGFGDLPVFTPPTVAVIATGDEVVVPGQPLPEGKLYASNMATLNAWCRHYGMGTTLQTVRDEWGALKASLLSAVDTCDAILTSGGAWTGDRDLVAMVLDELGWKKHFHRIRIGPGKAVGFGMFREKPVFILPGGPPSNLTAFLQIALPGLLRLSGYASPALPRISAVLKKPVPPGTLDWTQFVFGEIRSERGAALFFPHEQKSRLQSMAQATAMLTIPEGVGSLPAGKAVQVQLLS